MNRVGERTALSSQTTRERQIVVCINLQRPVPFFPFLLCDVDHRIYFMGSERSSIRLVIPCSPFFLCHMDSSIFKMLINIILIRQKNPINRSNFIHDS